MKHSHGARLATSISLLALSLVAVGVTCSINIKAGLEICPEAGVVMGVAGVGGLAAAAFAQFHGQSWLTAGALGLCCLTSVWVELHSWANGQATLLMNTKIALDSQHETQGELDSTRKQFETTGERTPPVVLRELIADAETDVKLADGVWRKAETAASAAHVECTARSAAGSRCLDALRALQAARAALAGLRERLGQALERERLLARLEAPRAVLPPLRERAAIPAMLAAAFGWRLDVVRETDQSIFTVLMVAINATFSILGGRSIGTLVNRQSGEHEKSEPVVLTRDETTHRAAPTDDELLALAESLDLRAIERQFNGAPGCSRATLGRRLQALRQNQRALANS